MQTQQAILTFTEAERPFGDRLLKLAVEIDRIEGYNEAHAIIIARMSETLGAMMGMRGSDLSAVKFAALAHDLGERQTKRNYLLRPDALTWEERLDLWRHPILGEQAAAEIRLPRHAQLLIRWHHEWWNGQGYPDGLMGEAIPLGARILRAVDSYYALISKRPYRNNYDPLEAEQILADQAGLEFDPMVVKSLLAALAEEKKNRESEFLASLPSYAPPLPNNEWGSPVIPPLSSPVSFTGPVFLNDDPLETDPEEAIALEPPQEEPLSELLAEIPEALPEPISSLAANMTANLPPNMEEAEDSPVNMISPHPSPEALPALNPEASVFEETAVPALNPEASVFEETAVADEATKPTEN